MTTKNSFLATQYILNILKTDTELMKLMKKNNIFPVNAVMTTSYPFVVIERIGMNPDFSKDGSVTDVIRLAIAVVSNDYKETIVIANEIRNYLDRHGWHDDNINISEIRLANASETIQQDAFVQYLEFTVTVIA